MINNLITYLTYENIYLIVNWGVIPFWILLIIAPNQLITRILSRSILVPLLLASAYIFISYKIFNDGNIFEGFNLYADLNSLYAVFSNEAFLLVFWIHFLSISLFVGCWIAGDSQKYMIPRVICIFSLIFTYFTGPIGLVFYWIFRIFYSKKINFND